MSYATIARGYEGGLIYARPSGGYYSSQHIIPRGTLVDTSLSYHYYHQEWSQSAESWSQLAEKNLFKIILKTQNITYINSWYKRLSDSSRRRIMQITRNHIKNSDLPLPYYCCPYKRIGPHKRMVKFLTQQNILKIFRTPKSLMKLCLLQMPTLHIYDALYLARYKKRYDKWWWKIVDLALWCMSPIENDFKIIRDNVTQMTWFLDGVVCVSLPEELIK